MIEGMEMQRKYERNQHIQTLDIMRKVGVFVANIGQAFSENPEHVKMKDLLPIPEIDKQIEKIEKQQDKEWDQKAEQVLQKYKKYTK